MNKTTGKMIFQETPEIRTKPAKIAKKASRPPKSCWRANKAKDRYRIDGSTLESKANLVVTSAHAPYFFVKIGQWSVTALE